MRGGRWRCSARRQFAIEFPSRRDAGAAAFRRADTLWLVFDSAAKIDLACAQRRRPRSDRGATLESGTTREHRAHCLERPRFVSLDTDGPGWIVILGDSVAVPTRPLGIARSIVGKGRASIAVPFDDARKVNRLHDPDVGDRLIVIPGWGRRAAS